MVELIEAEELKPGDRLPSVQSLAARFSVAAPTMRESLRRLQAIGIVEIKHGSGIYVRSAPGRVVLANPYSGGIDSQAILDLLDARLLIEPRLAELAAERTGPADVAELAWILDRAGEMLEGHDELLSRLNLGFHRAVAQLSGNSILSQTIDSLLDLYAGEQLVILALYDDRRHDHEEHLTIFDAIRDGDPKRAAKLMKRHIEGVRAVVARRLADDAGQRGEPEAAARFALAGAGARPRGSRGVRKTENRPTGRSR